MSSEATIRATEKVKELHKQREMEHMTPQQQLDERATPFVARRHRHMAAMEPQEQQLLLLQQQQQFHQQRRNAHQHKNTRNLKQFSYQEEPYLRRRAEDVEYWRQRAGWFNDDESMKAYNNGIYDSYYGLDDDSGGGGGRRGRGGKDQIVKNTLKILSIIVALGLSFLMFRAIMRRMNTDRKDKKHHHGGRHSDSKSRSSSVKRSRSRSRSRRGDYDLMKDNHHRSHKDDESRSRRSSRSKSSSKRRSRSRSRSGRSRSKPRAEKPTEPVKAAVLV